ncbi:hypothetical protein Mapa_016390 [Marchantia paleacea]|nr:hypothetical protein Mapa_016390 [Marchantia paleacea]
MEGFLARCSSFPSLPFSFSISVVSKGAEQKERVRDLKTHSYTNSTVFAFDGLMSIDGEREERSQI